MTRPPDAQLLPEFRNLPVGLDAARAAGSQFYWARPCRHGHPGPHYTKCSKCVTCCRSLSNGTSARHLANIGKVRADLPFLHILGDWSPVMINIGPLLAVPLEAASTI